MQLDHRATVISPGFTPLPGGPSTPDDPGFKRILCEGDSWFSLGAIPSSNMLFPLRFAEPTLLYNLATPGDTIVNMSAMAKNADLANMICGEGFAIAWDLIFISGGGNDLMDRADRLLCRPSAGAGQHMLDYVNQIELSRLKAEIQRAYMDIAALRNRPHSANQETPIVAHVYDYPTPRNAPAKFLIFGIAGPWLYRAFKAHEIPDSLWISLTDHLFEWLAGVMIDLTNKIDNFHVITNTRETLTRAHIGDTGESGDWLNEIHPTAVGYEKLSTVVSPELYHLLHR